MPFSFSTLVPEHYSPGHAAFLTENGIQHFSVGIEPNKNPFVTISQCNMSAALSIVLNRANHPLLIHCNKGKVSALSKKKKGPLQNSLLNQSNSTAPAA